MSELTPSKRKGEESRKRVEALKSLPKSAHIHIAGICGTGTASVGALLHSLGYRVTGSDKAFYPPMGDVVRGYCDKIFEGYSEENLSDRPELVVIGNSLSRGNPEVEFVLESGIPFCSMPEVFEALLIGDRDFCPTSVVATGTHGKTTTSALITQMFASAGREPGFFIGGVPKNLGLSIRAVSEETELSKRVVVLEGDEYDSAFFSKYAKFHHYRADIVVLTSLEFDHGDIYETLDDIIAEFQILVESIPDTGAILVCDETELLRDLASRWKNSDKVRAKVYLYGGREDTDFRLLSREALAGKGQKLSCDLKGKRVEFELPLTGTHNALNALSGAAVGNLVGLSSEEVAKGLSTFEGVLRRQHVVGEFNGVLLIEDFAHHPTEVRVTLDGLKESFPDRRLVAVFEPRSNTSRRAFFQKDYVESFRSADVSVLKGIEETASYAKQGMDTTPLNVPMLVEDIRQSGSPAESFLSIEEILNFLVAQAKPNDLFVVMSNGDFGGLLSKLRSRLL